MANTGFLSTTDLDFNGIKKSLKEYLKGNDKFRDYDFEGSNMSVLLDLLSYNTYLNAHYLNMTGGEMFIDTSQLRESVVSHSKELNYIPRSKTSAKAIVDITISAPSAPSYVTIPKYYRLETSIDGVTYGFTVPNSIVVKPVNGVYKALNVSIYEGEIVTEYFTANTSTRFILSSENIDTNSIEVEVINSSTDSTSATWIKSDSLFGLDGSSKVFFIQGYAANQYELVFGNDVLGKALSNGNLVKVTYRDTVGEAGNGAYLFSKTGSISGFSGISVSTVEVANEGSERETIDSIKYNAPRHFTVQERGVTEDDFVNLVKARFPQIQAVTAYGGELADPPQYGKVIVSIKPYGTNALISNSLKNQVATFLSTKTLTTEAVVIDPKYIYAFVRSNVTYNPSLTTRSGVDIQTEVFNSIVGINDTSLTNFGSDLRYSKLVSSIDSIDPSIVSNETNILVGSRWSPIANFYQPFTFNFENELYHEDELYVLPDKHEPTVFTTKPFKYLKNNTLYDAYISDNGKRGNSTTQGQLYVYTLVTDQTGNTSKLVLQSDAGYVDYYTGQVTISVDVYSYVGQYITIYARLFNKDIITSKNSFLIVDPEDVDVTVEAGS